MNNKASGQNAEGSQPVPVDQSRSPCDHVVGYAICEEMYGSCEGGYAVTISREYERRDLDERFAFCPRCGARLEER